MMGSRPMSVLCQDTGSSVRKSARTSGVLTPGVAFALLAALFFAASTPPCAQAQFGPPPAPRPPRAAAPIDITGYWVSVVTEDWRFRMIVPDKGDFASVPLNPEGRKAANDWDPARDQATGNQCRSYGAAALLRVPGRLHISWQNDTTLRIDTDSGTQTRLLHFDLAPQPDATPSWQGFSVAEWQGTREAFNPYMGQHSRDQRPEGYLKVVTTRMLPGYLRKNGVPYGANTVLEEYFDSFQEMNGDTWLVVTTIVKDPQYLFQPFITSSHFKKLAGASGWDPTPCKSDEPR
jgi:hypothetical protein